MVYTNTNKKHIIAKAIHSSLCSESKNINVHFFFLYKDIVWTKLQIQTMNNSFHYLCFWKKIIRPRYLFYNLYYKQLLYIKSTSKNII